MVRNDDFFLRKWIEYYARQLGRENLYILVDGKDQEIPDFTQGCNVKVFDHINENVRAGDKRRAGILSALASQLSSKYDFIIGTDVDEFLIVDPALKIGLKEFLYKEGKSHSCISGLGIDVGMIESEEESLNPNTPILTQRKYGLIYSRYTKPSVIRGNLRWGSGFHRVKGKNYHIAKDLYLFHCGGCDISLILAKQSRSELKENGWDRHLTKRLLTIRRIESAVKKGNLYDWTNAVCLSRISQTLLRPIFAWNKPTMFGITPVIQIPKRFKEII